MKNEFLAIFTKLLSISVLAFLSLQASFLFQNEDADTYNAYISTGENDFGYFMMSVTDEVGFFEKNDRRFYRESEPSMFRSGTVNSNGLEYYLLETWPLYFENQDPLINTIYQKIYCWYGDLRHFDDSFQVGMSVTLFQKLYPEIDLHKFSSATFSFELDGTLLEAGISFLFDGNLFSKKTNEGKMYGAVFGDDYLFANKAIIRELGFNTLNIVYSQTNYSKEFNFRLFNSFSSPQIQTHEYFSKTNEMIARGFNMNKTILPVRILCFSIELVAFGLLLFFQIKRKRPFVTHIFFGLSYSGALLFAVLLQKLTKYNIFVSASGFWFPFFVGLAGIIALLVLRETMKRKTRSSSVYDFYEAHIG